MHNGSFSHIKVADHFRVNHSIIVRLIQSFRQTANVIDRPRADSPRKTTPREDRLISRQARQRPFRTAGALRGKLGFGGHISTRTVMIRIHHQGIQARRPITRPQLTLRHRHARFDWSHDHLGWTIHTWRRVHWTDESRFLLRPTDGRARVWRQRNISFQDNHILGTTAFESGGVTVYGCFSFDYKLDLYVLDGSLTGQKYRDSVLAPRVVPHFDNHMLADRPMFMDNNARPHRARIIQHLFTARGCSDNAMACDVARHEPYWAGMGLYWPTKITNAIQNVKILTN